MIICRVCGRHTTSLVCYDCWAWAYCFIVYIKHGGYNGERC